MNNFQRIKAMDIDEMAEFLKQNCALLVAKKAGSDYVDEDLVKQWLESEVRE